MTIQDHKSRDQRYVGATLTLVWRATSEVLRRGSDRDRGIAYRDARGEEVSDVAGPPHRTLTLRSLPLPDHAEAKT
jgi:hypothetical protein